MFKNDFWETAKENAHESASLTTHNRSDTEFDIRPSSRSVNLSAIVKAF